MIKGFASCGLYPLCKGAISEEKLRKCVADVKWHLNNDMKWHLDGQFQGGDKDGGEAGGEDGEEDNDTNNNNVVERDFYADR